MLKKIDTRRDTYLKDLGWDGFRIKWSSYQKMNEEEKHLLISEIKEFLNKKNPTGTTSLLSLE